MKLFIAIASILLVGLVAAQEDTCFKAAENACNPNPNPNNKEEDLASCNSKFGGIKHAESLLQGYVNDQLVASYDYTLLATFFNSFQKQRPGFEKLFRSLSDQAFENSIKIIKYITRRGGSADFRYHPESRQTITAKKYLELDELHALAKALDMEKKLSEKAMLIHSHSSKHLADSSKYDPEITQFLEEELLSKQTADIRKLSGFTNDLWKMMNATSSNSAALSVYLFDEYLQKQ